MPRHGQFVWNELNTHDPDAAKAFYAATIGWRFEPMPMPDGSTYWVGMDGATPACGLLTLAGERFSDVPNHWFAYLEVDDLDRRVGDIESAGGSVVRAPWEIAGVGRVAIVRAPGGEVMGWMRSLARPS